MFNNNFEKNKILNNFATYTTRNMFFKTCQVIFEPFYITYFECLEINKYCLRQVQ
jgi:hypothetical protein